MVSSDNQGAGNTCCVEKKGTKVQSTVMTKGRGEGRGAGRGRRERESIGEKGEEGDRGEGRGRG